MSFAPVPPESKTQIRAAGNILVQNAVSPSEYEQALDLARRWRACHAYPINTFQATLRDKIRPFKGDPIVAQRLKRMPTIIDKLRRYPSMNLTTMHDISGIRAIVDSIDDVRHIADQYRSSTRFKHALIREDNYIDQPRSEDGYRSLHLIYKYRNDYAPSYNGLRVELQIRTKLQHMWATAVETMGTFLGQALKSRQGDQQWLDFFAIVSSAFAYMEETSLVPRFEELSQRDTAQRIANANAQMNALSAMDGISAAVDHISRSPGGKSSFYHVIVLNSENRSVSITPYDRDSFDQASAHYANVENRAASGERIEPVLVSAGPIDKLRRAYPSFFLDIQDFVANVRGIIANRMEHD